MALIKDKEHNVLVHRVKRACRVSYVLLRVLFAVIIVVWSLLFLLGLLSFVLPDTFGLVGILDWSVLLNFLIIGLLSAVFVGMMMLVLRDISRGETPFSRKQSKRIRLIAYFMFARVLFDLLFSVVTAALYSSGVTVLSYPVSVSLQPTLYLNLEALIFAIVLYCVSLVFEYGVLLQHDSDAIL